MRSRTQSGAGADADRAGAAAASSHVRQRILHDEECGEMGVPHASHGAAASALSKYDARYSQSSTQHHFHRSSQSSCVPGNHKLVPLLPASTNGNVNANDSAPTSSPALAKGPAFAPQPQNQLSGSLEPTSEASPSSSQTDLASSDNDKKNSKSFSYLLLGCLVFLTLILVVLLIVYFLLPDQSEEEDHAHDAHHGHSHDFHKKSLEICAPKSSPSFKAWLLTTMVLLFLTLLSALGLLLVPIFRRAPHCENFIMVGLIGMGVGTLLGDAFLHLIPDALGVHSHDQDGNCLKDVDHLSAAEKEKMIKGYDTAQANLPDGFEIVLKHESEYVKIYVAASIAFGVFCFYVADHLLQIFDVGSCKGGHAHSHHHNMHKQPAPAPPSAQPEHHHDQDRNSHSHHQNYKLQPQQYEQDPHYQRKCKGLDRAVTVSPPISTSAANEDNLTGGCAIHVDGCEHAHHIEAQPVYFFDSFSSTHTEPDAADFAKPKKTPSASLGRDHICFTTVLQPLSVGSRHCAANLISQENRCDCPESYDCGCLAEECTSSCGIKPLPQAAQLCCADNPMCPAHATEFSAGANCSNNCCTGHMPLDNTTIIASCTHDAPPFYGDHQKPQSDFREGSDHHINHNKTQQTLETQVGENDRHGHDLDLRVQNCRQLITSESCISPQTSRSMHHQTTFDRQQQHQHYNHNIHHTLSHQENYNSIHVSNCNNNNNKKNNKINIGSQANNISHGTNRRAHHQRHRSCSHANNLTLNLKAPGIEQVPKWRADPWYYKLLPRGFLRFLTGMPRIAWLILLGDALHNFMDGVVIGLAFWHRKSAISTAIAVTLHELPHELGDFGVLLMAGIPAGKAALMNMLSQSTAFAGGFIAMALGPILNKTFQRMTMGFTAGGFIYIALADLVPVLLSMTLSTDTPTPSAQTSSEAHHCGCPENSNSGTKNSSSSASAVASSAHCDLDKAANPGAQESKCKRKNARLKGWETQAGRTLSALKLFSVAFGLVAMILLVWYENNSHEHHDHDGDDHEGHSHHA